MTRNEIKREIYHDTKEQIYDMLGIFMKKYRDYLTPLEIANMVADATCEIGFIFACDTMEDIYNDAEQKRERKNSK